MKTPSQFYIKTDDFLISRRQIVHGACAIVPPSLDGSIVSNEYAVLHPKSILHLKFFEYFSHTIYFQQTCFHSSIGVHVEKMVFRIGNWLNWHFNLPPLSEQIQIAAILSAWDDSLSTLAQLIDTKRQQKRALAEQLLTGKRRLKGFDGEWAPQPIGKLFRKVTRFIDWDDSGQYTQAIVRRWSQGITTRAELDANDIKVKKLQKVKEGDFLVSNIQAAYGAMAKVGPAEAGLHVSNLYTILEAREGHGSVEYLDQFSRTSRMEGLVIASSNGFKAERVRLNFDPKVFLKQTIPVPPTVKEQQAIASVLFALDSEIDLLTHQQAKVQEQKRGLMDLLLTGKVRVQVSGEVPA